MKVSTHPRRVLVPALAAGLVASFALAGCSQVEQTGTAAVVNGERITDDEVQTATREITAQPNLDTVTPSQVLQMLAYGKIADPLAAKYGKVISDSTVVQALPAFKGASPATLETLRANVLLSQSLQSQNPFGDAFVKAAKEADISINPRYGSIDRAAQLPIKDPVVPWIKADAVTTGQGDTDQPG